MTWLMIANRKLTPDEQAKLRDFQTREILRRRSGDPVGAAEAMAEVDAEVAGRLAAGGAKCPDCGTPYGERKRCYRCKPTRPARPKPEPVPACIKCGKPRGAAKQGRCFRCEFGEPVPATEPAVVVTPEPVAEPDVTDHVADVGKLVEVRGNGELVMSAPAPIAAPPIPIMTYHFGPGLTGPPDPIVALRRVVDALAGLDADAVKWVLESAARLPRPDAPGDA